MHLSIAVLFVLSQIDGNLMPTVAGAFAKTFSIRNLRRMTNCCGQTNNWWFSETTIQHLKSFILYSNKRINFFVEYRILQKRYSPIKGNNKKFVKHILKSHSHKLTKNCWFYIKKKFKKNFSIIKQKKNLHWNVDSEKWLGVICCCAVPD